MIFSWEVRAFQWLQMCCSVSAPHSVSKWGCADARSLHSCWRWQWAGRSWWAFIAIWNLLLCCTAGLDSTESEGLQKALRTCEMLWIGACCYSVPLDSWLTSFSNFLQVLLLFSTKKSNNDSQQLSLDSKAGNWFVSLCSSWTKVRTGCHTTKEKVNLCVIIKADMRKYLIQNSLIVVLSWFCVPNAEL